MQCGALEIHFNQFAALADGSLGVDVVIHMGFS